MNDFGPMKTKRHARALGRDFKKRDAPIKACYHCGLMLPNGTRICPECGFEFFSKVVKGPSPFKGVPTKERKPAKDARYRCD